MDAKRRRLRDDWRGHFQGELLLDDLSRGLYATDASLFEIEPLAVAVPRDEEDVQFLVRYAREQHLSLVPRGAGTGVAGESLGPGIIVDLSVHFRNIVDIAADTVRVQPGVVLRTLNNELAKQGRRFAPDTASAGSCTIGGMLATNASGSNVLVHGYTREHVHSIRAVWDTGDASTLERAPAGDARHVTPLDRLSSIIHDTTQLLDRRAELIRASRPRTPFNRLGYALDGVLTPNGLDLPALLVGSEGTLAVFTEAVLKTIPLPGGKSAVLFGFETLENALKAALVARPLHPSACELLDRRLLMLTRSQSAESARCIPSDVEAALLIEFERDTPEEAREAGLEIVDRLQRTNPWAVHAVPAFDEAGVARLWQVRDAALPALYAMGKGARPLAFVEDLGVPPEALPEFLGRLQGVLQQFETTASFMIHAATGQVHARPFLDLDQPADREKLWSIADQVHQLTIDMGGTISAQHGTGLARTPWVERQIGPLAEVFRDIKAIFDPAGVLNPGKIVGLDPSRPAWPLRGGSLRPIKHQLNWADGDLPCQVGACNGCGACRTEAVNQRMCPTFRVDHAEAATPRAKANMLRQLLSGPDESPLGANEVREVADLCINCKMCAQECPAHVDVPRLMLEARAANVAEHGLDRSDWLLSRIESFAALGSNFALISNTLLGNRLFRWLAERLFGVSRKRRLPTFAARTFLKRAVRRGWTRKRNRPAANGKVAYFVDLFPNVFDPSIAEATVAVLHHHGIEVLVPPLQKSCGMAPLALGDLESAREVVRHNLRQFVELAREGYVILCSEPTAAIMLKHEAIALLDDGDARTVARATEELTAFLGKLHAEGKLRTDFRQSLNVSIGHHVPCHVKALGAGVHGPDLLSLIPQLKVHTIDVSCSGMAGTFGLKSKNFEASLRAGAPMLGELSRPRVLFGSTECGSCRMQMEQGAGKRTLHPVQYLAFAYGLMPELERRLRQPLRDLVTT